MLQIFLMHNLINVYCKTVDCICFEQLQCIYLLIHVRDLSYVSGKGYLSEELWLVMIQKSLENLRDWIYITSYYTLLGLDLRFHFIQWIYFSFYVSLIMCFFWWKNRNIIEI